MLLSSVSSSWVALPVMALLVVSTVSAYPVGESSSKAIEPRSPRLIPDTENYLASIFDMLGLSSPVPSDTPSSSDTASPSETATASATPSPSNSHVPLAPLTTPGFPTATIHAEQGEPENIKATPTKTSNEVSYTTVVKHEDSTKPIENIQIGAGWDGKNRIAASDVPVILNALYKEMANRFNNVVDSSDEVGLLR